MSEERAPGRIISFYSFKGGVGRTMALANVAFLAAKNDLRVLVMDWDLEAPGLHHYFRGLLEPDKMAELRAAPGVLDLAWAWRNGIDQATDAEQIDEQFKRFRNGEPFEQLVRSVLEEDELGESGCLDIIPAGGDTVATPESVEYERALAAMSWNELLDRYAGGGLIDALRHWASANYDLVLIDSRTGLADVAGICTMQLPDAVVLSFVLNRQNIEGVARVASAIRRNRGDTLKIWAVPMRVSREGTDEEADASARALRELTRPGRLDREATERDLKQLQIKAEPNVPFMESLSAFNDTNAALDPLTANMARLASEITGRSIAIPEISEQWRDLVSSRLAPTLSTDTYLHQLLTAEPGRAGRQLHGYVESAISTIVEGDELADDYVATLAETAIAFQQRSDLHLGNERYDTPNRIVTLLRKMCDRDPATWRQLLVAALESALDTDMTWLGPDDEAVALEEIDELLAAEEQDAATIERRVEMRMRAARLYEMLVDPLQQLAAADDALALIRIAWRLPDGDSGDWQARRLDALLQRAAAQERLEQQEEAADTLRKVVRTVAEYEDVDSANAHRFGFDANYRLMRLLRQAGGEPKEIAKFALEATRLAAPNVPTFITRIPELADAVLACEPSGKAAAELLRRAVAPPATPRAYSQFGRAVASGARVTQSLGDLLRAAARAISEDERAMLAELAAHVVRVTTLAGSERINSLSHRNPTSGSLRQSLAILPASIKALRSFLEVANSAGDTPGLSASLGELEALAEDLEQHALEIQSRVPPRPKRAPS